ncbi:MAG TPA: monovalent cation:proton antiporter-2 (CPA2) family protein, partial [Burkholderiales bacterium]|nr:monovalent cation:proton antiporter-2 (CPA2) family protein [Burkholderiales bacterium]
MEHGNDFLIQASLYFAAAVAAVMISHRLGLGSVAGYLLAGIAIGPWGFQLVETGDQIRAFAELGVVFLLFVIGLELEPKRLWNMRSQLLGLGLGQVVGSIAAITLAGWALGFDWRVALIAGMALSLSSTALALAPLTERGALATKGGQGTFAVLLFQDIAVIPMLAVLPLLGAAQGGAGLSWQKVALALAVIVVTLGGGRLLARPVFRHIARTRLREIFTAFALLLVLVIALAFEHAGMSMALGAFLGGVLLAESEYRHEIEAAVEPFKGLLLGLFFIAVGMSADFGVLIERPWAVFGLIALVIAGGRYLLRPALRIIAATKLREVFVGFSLLLVVGIGALMEAAGLSMALGAFLAGVLLADSEYRHELELDIEPFKGLLLGLFFIAVGMSVDLGLFLRSPLLVLGLALGIVALKSAILYAVARPFYCGAGDAALFALALSQAGEFAFVLFTAASRILPPATAAMLNAAVAVSMLTTPFLIMGYQRFLARRSERRA